MTNQENLSFRVEYMKAKLARLRLEIIALENELMDAEQELLKQKDIYSHE